MAKRVKKEGQKVVRLYSDILWYRKLCIFFFKLLSIRPHLCPCKFQCSNYREIRTLLFSTTPFIYLLLFFGLVVDPESTLLSMASNFVIIFGDYCISNHPLNFHNSIFFYFLHILIHSYSFFFKMINFLS